MSHRTLGLLEGGAKNQGWGAGRRSRVPSAEVLSRSEIVRYAKVCADYTWRKGNKTMHRRGEPSLLGEKLGPYYIKERLGQGGMGAVYLARDTALDRTVALKVLLARHASDSEFVARFQREARAVAQLSHPNIVQVYTVDVASDPPYMAMEYIEGEDLESYIRNHERLGWQQALGFVMQVADALACAHKANIIHRDIKPANILIDQHGIKHESDGDRAHRGESHLYVARTMWRGRGRACE